MFSQNSCSVLELQWFSCVIHVEIKLIWATSWENLFIPYANNKDADRPAHPHSLISTFIVRCLDSIISLVSISEISRLWLASVAEQVSLSLTWSQTSKDRFSCDVAHMMYEYYLSDLYSNAGTTFCLRYFLCLHYTTTDKGKSLEFSLSEVS